MNNAQGVRTQSKEYTKMAPRWKKIRDVLSANCKSYLRNVGASEADKTYGAQRQKEYEDGAVFFAFAARTLKGIVGDITRKPPEIEVPDELEYLLENCDGTGLGLVQQSQSALNDCAGLGRFGLLSDAPAVQGASKADENAGKLNPAIQYYAPENIIDWRHDTVKGVSVLTQVRLRETYECPDGLDEFQWLEGEQVRVLEIVDGKYQQRLFKFDVTGAQNGEAKLITPRRQGKQFTKIPFEFGGADNNDSKIDEPPLNTLTDINIGHFRNSADVEDSAAIVGSPTLMISPGDSMSGDRFSKANPNGVRLGSRTGHNLGFGGKSELLQASPNNLSRELMRDKEDQALKAGAQLIAPSAQITAESARLQRGADTSIAASVANNVSDAYEKAIGHCAEMKGLSDEGVKFQLNTEFFMLQMTAQDRLAWMADINSSIMPVRAYTAAMREAGLTKWTDEQIEEELERQPPPPGLELNTDVVGEIPKAPEEE